MLLLPLLPNWTQGVVLRLASADIVSQKCSYSIAFPDGVHRQVRHKDMPQEWELKQDLYVSISFGNKQADTLLLQTCTAALESLVLVSGTVWISLTSLEIGEKCPSSACQGCFEVCSNCAITGMEDTHAAKVPGFISGCLNRVVPEGGHWICCMYQKAASTLHGAEGLRHTGQQLWLLCLPSNTRGLLLPTFPSALVPPEVPLHSQTIGNSSLWDGVASPPFTTCFLV